MRVLFDGLKHAGKSVRSQSLAAAIDAMGRAGLAAGEEAATMCV